MDFAAIEKEYEFGVYPKRSVSLAYGKEEFVYDYDGKEYVDCTTGIGVALLGHAHPKIIGAINEQARKLITCNEIFPNEKRTLLLKKLAEIAPNGLKKSFLCNSGAEAIECAMKLARAYTKKSKFISTMNAFHGKTFGSLSLTYKEHYREPFKPLVEPTVFVRYGDADALKQAIDSNTAAFFVEPVQGEGGVRVAPDGYLKEVQEICNERGVLLVVDEIQTGLGRTGKMFACEHWNVTPDIMCLAKGIAGGIPMGATIAREEIVNLKPLQHSTTFGGNPLACAAALSTIELIQKENLVERAAKEGAYFLNELRRLEKKKEAREARGLGLMLALELKTKAKSAIDSCAERGLLVLLAGDMVMRFLPPLIIRRSSIDKVLDILDEVLI
jgi:acetylornithine/LysW-gamma-L-lysine aminotransferase